MYSLPFYNINFLHSCTFIVFNSTYSLLAVKILFLQSGFKHLVLYSSTCLSLGVTFHCVHVCGVKRLKI